MTWQRQAACVNADPDLFFPDLGRVAGVLQSVDARTICAGCPVRAPCLNFAIREDIRDGIWGGTLPDERPRTRRQPIDHGTPGGYIAHRRRGETPCFECKEANNRYKREADQRRAGRRAGQPAPARLTDPATAADAVQWTKTCLSCKTTFTQRRRPGRPDRYCPDCKGSGPRAALAG
jgi:WhiB family redox-sensing transcriptional regulator